MSSHLRRRASVVAILSLTLLLSACGVGNGNQRPEDPKLRDGIKLLMAQFQTNHPQLVNWDKEKVLAQINHPLPNGLATEAGWAITWPNYAPGELPRVVIPWVVLGQYPEKFALDTNNYSGGTPVPVAVQTDIAAQQIKGDTYFAAIVHMRYSTVDPAWVIFTSVPYMPITDDAYGWAHVVNKKWVIADFGTALVGCGQVPGSVQHEFGFSCPAA
jgi:hypothetical protein